MFIQLRLKTAEKVSRLSEVSPLIISVLIVFGVNILTAKYNAVINRTLVFILIMFSLRCIQHNLLRNTLAVVILIPVALDTTIQLYAWHNFRTEFSYGFALSILDTTPSEAKGMLGLYWRDCLSFVTLAAFFIYAANTGANLIPYRFHRYPPILLAITIIAFVGQAYLHQIRKSNVESLMQRVLSATPLSTGKVFMQAIQDISIMSDIGNNIPDYKITLTDTGIENYVLIIGESARAVNMGLYGYPRDTTPELIKQKHQLLLFQNAIAPAPVTIMAVPMAMTADSVNAHQQEWVDHGYDEALLPLLQNALQKPGKKLIVLHLYGSHEPSCERFPESSTILAGESQADDCYDNSIRYTDTLMGNIFSALQNTRSSVMYFSDHALIRDPKRAVVYSHGGVTPPKEALHIPMFIWYSQLVDAKTKLTGDYRTQWSSDDLNTLAELWLGIHRQGAPINTLSSWLMNYDKTIFIMDTTGKQYEWRNVR